MDWYIVQSLAPITIAISFLQIGSMCCHSKFFGRKVNWVVVLSNMYAELLYKY